ncbi:MAG: cell division protein FtsL [Nitrospinales bacterium]
MNGWFQVSPKEVSLILVISLLFMAGSMAFVWSNVKMVKYAYEFQALKKKRHQLARENRLLKLEKESLTSLYRIQTLTQKELGLLPMENNQVITVFLK